MTKLGVQSILDLYFVAYPVFVTAAIVMDQIIKRLDVFTVVTSPILLMFELGSLWAVGFGVIMTCWIVLDIPALKYKLAWQMAAIVLWPIIPIVIYFRYARGRIREMVEQGRLSMRLRRADIAVSCLLGITAAWFSVLVNGEVFPIPSVWLVCLGTAGVAIVRYRDYYQRAFTACTLAAIASLVAIGSFYVIAQLDTCRFVIDVPLTIRRFAVAAYVCVTVFVAGTLWTLALIAIMARAWRILRKGPPWLNVARR